MGKNKVPLIVALVCLLVIAGTWFAFIVPERELQAGLNQEISNLEDQKIQLETDLKVIRELQANQVETRAKLSRLDGLLPKGSNQASLLASLKVVEESAGVNIDSINFTPPTEFTDSTPSNGMQLNQMEVAISVEGGYFQLVDFLRRLEYQFGRTLLIDSVSILENTTDSNTVSTADLKMSINSKSFFYLPIGASETVDGEIVDDQAVTEGDVPVENPDEGAVESVDGEQ